MEKEYQDKFDQEIRRLLKDQPIDWVTRSEEDKANFKKVANKVIDSYAAKGFEKLMNLKYPIVFDCKFNGIDYQVEIQDLEENPDHIRY